MKELRERGQKLKDLTLKKKELEAELAAVNKERAALIEEINNLMFELGLEKAHFDFGLVKTYEPKLRVSVNKEDEPRLLAWLKQQGLDGIIKEEPVVNKMTLAAMLKEEIANGLELPEFIKTYWQPDVRVL